MSLKRLLRADRGLTCVKECRSEGDAKEKCENIANKKTNRAGRFASRPLACSMGRADLSALAREAFFCIVGTGLAEAGWALGLQAVRLVMRFR